MVTLSLNNTIIIINKHGRSNINSIEGELKYYGQCKDGQKHGKGKEYYDNGIILYDGEWKDGQKHGKGEEYYFNGKIKYNINNHKGVINGYKH